MERKIIEILNSRNLDLRISGNARFMDQKVTPDVLSIVCDCIMNYTMQTFTSGDIRMQEYSNENVKYIFNKPGIENYNTFNEYDKFFMQPLKMLAYAGILTESGQRNKCFKVEYYDILEYISLGERNALKFIQLYIEKVLNDSGIALLFRNFFDYQDKISFYRLKQGYIGFIKYYTPINTDIEVSRIFTKVLNPLAFKYKKFGTRAGRISKTIIEQNELMYNRINFRDKKIKSIARNEIISEEITPYEKYSINKAKKIVGKLSLVSEIRGEINSSYNIHHIFPKSQFPEFEAYLENLIKLTPNQHVSQAHPNGNFHEIDIQFQELCILAKAQTIESFTRMENLYYSKENFVELLNGCLFINKKELLKVNEDESFYDITKKIMSAYRQIEQCNSEFFI